MVSVDTAARLLLIAIKKGELTIYPEKDNTCDYVQILEEAIKREDSYKIPIPPIEWFKEPTPVEFTDPESLLFTVTNNKLFNNEKPNEKESDLNKRRDRFIGL